MTQFIVDELSPHMRFHATYHALRPDLRILTALFFFANGSYQRVLGHSWALSMSQSSVSRCVREVSNLILEHMADDWIKFPTTEREIIREKMKFMQGVQFPGTLGAVDCTQVAILAPSQDEHAYYCRKHYHSKNIQIVRNFWYLHKSCIFNDFIPILDKCRKR